MKLDNEPKKCPTKFCRAEIVVLFPSCVKRRDPFLFSDVVKITALHATTQLKETYWAMGKGPEVLLGMTSQTKVHGEQEGSCDAS